MVAQGLKKLGATEVIGALTTDSKALDEERWGGAIDVVGGPTIPTIASQMCYGCSIASCGVAGGPAIKTTVYPFIIRGDKPKKIKKDHLFFGISATDCACKTCQV